jgi:hypothetical protein
MEKLLGKCARLIRNWKLLNKPEEATKLEQWSKSWKDQQGSKSSGSESMRV